MTCSDTWKFTKEVDLASLKSDVYKLDFDKLETDPANLNKLSDVAKKSC